MTVVPALGAPRTDGAAFDAAARSALLGGSVVLNWTNPPATDDDRLLVGVVVVRRERSFPLSTDDGRPVYSGPPVEQVVDESVAAGTRYYYTIFTRFASGGPVTGPAARAHALATGHADLPGRLYDLLPAVHRRDDVPAPGDPEVAGPLRGAGPLRRYLEALLAPLAFARSTAEGLAQLRDLEQAPPEFLPLLAGFLDAPLDVTVPVHLRRGELRAVPRLQRTAGTVEALAATVSRYTGWQTRITEYAQNIARANTPPRTGVFALRRTADGWAAADDAAPELGLGGADRRDVGGPGPAVLTGDRPGPFRVRDRSALTVQVGDLLPVRAVLREADIADPATSEAAEVAAALSARLRQVEVRARADGRVELTAAGPVGAPLQVLPQEPTLLTTAIAPRGRIAAADLGSAGVRLVHALREEQTGRTRLGGIAVHDGEPGEPFDVLPDVTGPVGEPALAALPAAAGQPARALLVWVADPGTATATIRWRTAEVTGPDPAVLTGKRAAPFKVLAPSMLVLQDGASRTRGASLMPTDVTDPAAATAAEVVAVLRPRLAGLAVPEVAPGGRVALRSVRRGPSAWLAVRTDLSDAAGPLGLNGSAAHAQGRARDGLAAIATGVVATVPPGRNADPVLVADPDGGVVLAVSRHDGVRWQVLALHGNVSADGATVVWSAPVTVSTDPESGRGARTPALGLDAGTVVLAWSARDGDDDTWTLRSATRAGGLWSAPGHLVPPPVGAATGDHEPALLPSPAGPSSVVFASDRGGSRSLWLQAADGSVAPVAEGPEADGWPTAVEVGGELWLLFRSDRNVLPARLGRDGGRDTGTLERRAGTTTAVLTDLRRARATGAWGDLLAYTPQRPDGGVTDPDDRYTPGTVGLHLSTGTGGSLDSAAADRLPDLLRRVLPATARVVVHLGGRPDRELVYQPRHDLGERYEDRYPEIDRVGSAREAGSAVGTGWSTVHSAVLGPPPPPDPAAGGTTADPGAPGGQRWRSHTPPPT